MRSLPSKVRRVSLPPATSLTYRSLYRVKAMRLLSGE